MAHSPLKAVWKDLKSVRHLGAGLLWRHPMGLLGRETHCVNVAGVGPVWLRSKGSDASVLRQVFAGREYDLSRFPQHERVQARLRRILADGKTPVIVDAGANIGLSSIWFALRYREAVIVAVEPDPANLAIARRNVARFQNIILAPAAIGGRAGKVHAIAGDGGYAARTQRDDDADTPVITVADAKALAGASAELLIVKIDIEGFEADLFAENVEWLDETAAIMVETHDWMLPGQYSSRPLQRAMWSRDFEVLVRGESLFFVR